jgi:aminoglycoside phosphotransferase (APT) family kinase protein
VAEWSAEVVVDEALARRLIGGQFPDVPLGRLELLGEGWDNTVWLADGRWVFRFPRREIAVPAVERQVALLPALAPLVPLPVPVPALAGAPAEGFPWPFFGARHLPGVEPADAGLDDDARSLLAAPLGAFVRALHETDLPTAAGLPVDPMGRADMALRVPRTRERVAELEALGLWSAPGRVQELLDDAESLPPAAGRVLAHGDLLIRHVLVDGGMPSAVIDWDDVCRGDPSIDLVLYWALLPPGSRAAFLEAYGRASDEQLLRARVLAVFLSGTLAVYGHHEGLALLEREALGSLERALRD